MLNELLTRNATREPERPELGPYREPGVLPPVRHACIACSQRYEAPAGSTPNRCPACHVAITPPICAARDA